MLGNPGPEIRSCVEDVLVPGPTDPDSERTCRLHLSRRKRIEGSRHARARAPRLPPSRHGGTGGCPTHQTHTAARLRGQPAVGGIAYGVRGRRYRLRERVRASIPHRLIEESVGSRAAAALCVWSTRNYSLPTLRPRRTLRNSNRDAPSPCLSAHATPTTTDRRGASLATLGLAREHACALRARTAVGPLVAEHLPRARPRMCARPPRWHASDNSGDHPRATNSGGDLSAGAHPKTAMDPALAVPPKSRCARCKSIRGRRSGARARTAVGAVPV